MADALPGSMDATEHALVFVVFALAGVTGYVLGNCKLGTPHVQDSARKARAFTFDYGWLSVAEQHQVTWT